MMGRFIDADDIGISLFSAYVQDTIIGLTKNVVQISEDFLDNAEGEPYFRWIMELNANGKELHQTFYIFGSDQWFLTVMYARPISAGAENDSVIEESMNSLRFE